MNPIDLLLDKIKASYPNLRNLTLSSHALTTEDIPAIQNFIQTMPSIRQVNILNNFFTAMEIFSLYNFAEQINSTRPSDEHLYIHTDYAVWVENNAARKYPTLQWALTPEQWVKEEDFHPLFYQLCSHIEDFNEFYPAFQFEFTYKNKLGMTPLLCASKISSYKILLALSKEVNIQVFTDQLIRDCEDPDVKNLNLHEFLPRIIFIFYLMDEDHLKEGDRLHQRLLTYDCAQKSEIQGMIAHNRKDYRAAYAHYKEGALKNSVTCHFEIAQMIMRGDAPDDENGDMNQLKHHLKSSADGGESVAQLQYGSMLEAEGNYTEAHCYYVKLSNTMQNPETKELIEGYLSSEFKQHVDFAYQIDALINALNSKRVMLAHQRFAQRSSGPVFFTFNTTELTDKLTQTLSTPCLNTLLRRHRTILLNKFKENPLLFDLIHKDLYEKMEACPPNLTLLSMNPEVYAQSVSDEIEDFLLKSKLMTIKMKSGRDATIT